MTVFPSTRRRAATVLTTGLALTTGLLVGGPSGATAQPEDSALLYSVDRASWSSEPPHALFDGWQAVPGSSRTATLYLRANRPGNTIIAIYVGSATSTERELLEQTSVARGDDRPWSLAAIADGEAGACALLGKQVVLRQGEETVLPITFRISSELRAAQRAVVGVDLLVALSETGPVVLSNGCPVDPAIIAAFPGGSTPTATPSSGAVAAPGATGGTGSLPSTGFALPIGALIIVGGFIVTGAALLTRRRRRRAPMGEPTTPSTEEIR